LPDCMASGSLETLCMSALSDDASLPCISQYFECLTREADCAPSPIVKAQVQAFLASRTRPGLQLGRPLTQGICPGITPHSIRLGHFSEVYEDRGTKPLCIPNQHLHRKRLRGSS
jgi:hypothetical protein